MKINKNLENIVKSIEGKLLGIGIDNKNIIDLIDKNDKIIDCDLLSCFIPGNSDETKIKKISRKKITKKLKRKFINTVICNLEAVEEFKEKFTYDLLYIGNDKIYIYSKKEDENLIRRYKRYCDVNIIKCNDGIIYELKIIKKINKFNKFYYKVIDTIIDFIEIISDLLSDS